MTDTEALAEFNAAIHNGGATEPEPVVAAWTRDLMSGTHPTFKPEDFLIVEDTRTGAIVSSVNHISQTWEYAGIPFKVGRPELVGTLPDYRNRGLVRKQFEILHEWSLERGEPVQAITGIFWYYKLFGYEYALQLGGARAGYAPHVPKLKEGESEQFTVRPAEDGDVPFIKHLYDLSLERSLVGCVRDEEIWRYELSGQAENSLEASALVIIQTPDGKPVGFIRHSKRLWASTLGVSALEIEPGVSWRAALPGAVRYIWAKGVEYAERGSKGPMGVFALRLGTEHPAYSFFDSGLPRNPRPYAWFIRVPDVPEFLMHIAPALEKNLEESDARGYTGELKVSNYRSAFKMVFDGGKLKGVENYKLAGNEDGHAFFPELTFLQALFGYRSADELQNARPDCWFANDEARVLVNVLFPKRHSQVLPVA